MRYPLRPLRGTDHMTLQHVRVSFQRLGPLAVAAVLAACAGTSGTMSNASMSVPSRDPRIGLRAGLFNAAEAVWNMRVLSETQPTEAFKGITNSDLAFLGNYAIQGSYN